MTPLSRSPAAIASVEIPSGYESSGGAASHPVASTASRMTRVTTGASEMRDRCPASTSVMRAPARLAMNVSSAGGMTRSPDPTHGPRRDGLPGRGPGRSGERAGRKGPLAGRDERRLAGGQAGGKAFGDQGRLDVEVDVTGRCAGVGHRVEGLVVQAGSGLRAGQAADGIALIGDEG